jgi:hypothetical protein
VCLRGRKLTSNKSSAEWSSQGNSSGGRQGLEKGRFSNEIQHWSEKIGIESKQDYALYTSHHMLETGVIIVENSLRSWLVQTPRAASYKLLQTSREIRRQTRGNVQILLNSSKKSLKPVVVCQSPLDVDTVKMACRKLVQYLYGSLHEHVLLRASISACNKFSAICITADIQCTVYKSGKFTTDIGKVQVKSQMLFELIP